MARTIVILLVELLFFVPVGLSVLITWFSWKPTSTH
jgi:hypothetical protein